MLNNCDDDIMQSSVLFYGGIEDDQYLENSTRISYDAENNVNVDLLASDTVNFFYEFCKTLILVPPIFLYFF